MEFFFDKFMKMATENPERFEKFREILIKQAMENTSLQIQQKLEDMQCRIDMERNATGSSMESCVKVFDLMADYFYAEYLPGVHMKMLVEKSKKLIIVRQPGENQPSTKKRA